MQYQPIQQKGLLKIPAWCYEDTPIDYDYVEDEEIFVRIIQNHSIKIDYEKYRDLRKVSYFACRWYPLLIEAKIPTIKSVLLRSSPLDLREDLSDYFQAHPDKWFVRLCGASPKDVDWTCIFDNSNDTADTLMRSHRTLNIMQTYDHCHLFLREVVDLLNECRCIVHQRKVRAISVYNQTKKQAELEASVIKFFDTYSQDLPYNSCVLELGWEDNYTKPFIIEINSFGTDGWAGASLFDWHAEKWLLYHAEKPVFRYYH